MSIIKDVATEVIKEVAVDAGLVAAGKGIKSAGDVAGFISQKVDGIKDIRIMCNTCFRNLEMICVPETPMLNVPEASVLAERLLEQFRKAGEEYDAVHSLKPETIRILETPMIPRDDYIKHVNRL